MEEIARTGKTADKVCSVCNGSGMMRYKDISVLTPRSWEPYKEKPCTYCDKGKTLIEKELNFEKARNGFRSVMVSHL